MQARHNLPGHWAKEPKDIVSFLILAVWGLGFSTLYCMVGLPIPTMIKWVGCVGILILLSILAKWIASFRKYGLVYLPECFSRIGVVGFGTAVAATVAFYAALSWLGLVSLNLGLYSGSLKNFGMIFVAYPLIFSAPLWFV